MDYKNYLTVADFEVFAQKYPEAYAWLLRRIENENDIARQNHGKGHMSELR